MVVSNGLLERALPSFTVSLFFWLLTPLTCWILATTTDYSYSAEVIGEPELIAVVADLFNKPGQAALLDELQFILERSRVQRGAFDLLKMPLSEQVGAVFEASVVCCLLASCVDVVDLIHVLLPYDASPPCLLYTSPSPRDRG